MNFSSLSTSASHSQLAIPQPAQLNLNVINPSLTAPVRSHGLATMAATSNTLRTRMAHCHVTTFGISTTILSWMGLSTPRAITLTTSKPTWSEAGRSRPTDASLISNLIESASSALLIQMSAAHPRFTNPGKPYTKTSKPSPGKLRSFLNRACGQWIPYVDPSVCACKALHPSGLTPVLPPRLESGCARARRAWV